MIVAVYDSTIDSAEDVVREVTRRSPGDSVRFTVWRGAQQRTVSVVLGERPANPPDTGR